MHGTDRRAQLDRDTWASFGEDRNLVIMSPLFPVGIDGPDDLHGYKNIESAGVRYDRALFGMLDEIRLRWGVDGEARFHLAGHSGGGQFALRMLLLHPQRLRGVVIGAPGRLTLVDPGSRWPRPRHRRTWPSASASASTSRPSPAPRSCSASDRRPRHGRPRRPARPLPGRLRHHPARKARHPRRRPARARRRPGDLHRSRRHPFRPSRNPRRPGVHRGSSLAQSAARCRT